MVILMLIGFNKKLVLNKYSYLFLSALTFYLFLFISFILKYLFISVNFSP